MTARLIPYSGGRAPLICQSDVAVRLWHPETDTILPRMEFPSDREAGAYINRALQNLQGKGWRATLFYTVAETINL